MAIEMMYIVGTYCTVLVTDKHAASNYVYYQKHVFLTYTCSSFVSMHETKCKSIYDAVSAFAYGL
jgi:hypothetical protein